MSEAEHNDLSELVADSDPDRYVATLFAPLVLRPALFALYAFDREVVRIAEIAHEPMAGHIRLGWWRGQIETIYGGGQITAPVAQALSNAVRSHRLPRVSFEHYLDARALDLEEAPFADEAAMEAHAGATSGSVVQLAARVLGAEARSDDAARLSGIARAYAGHIGSLAGFAKRRRCRLPLSWLEEAGLNAEDVFAASQNGLKLRGVLDRLGNRITTVLGGLNRSRFPTRAMPALAPATLARWTTRGFDPFRAHALPAWQRVARIAWSNLTWRF